MKIEKDAVTFEMPDADFVAKFGMQAAADMVLDFHCFHPQLPFLYDARQLAAFLSTSRQKLLYYARHTAAAYHRLSKGRHSQRQRRAPCGQTVSPEAGYLRLFRQYPL